MLTVAMGFVKHVQNVNSSWNCRRMWIYCMHPLSHGFREMIIWRSLASFTRQFQYLKLLFFIRIVNWCVELELQRECEQVRKKSAHRMHSTLGIIGDESVTQQLQMKPHAFIYVALSMFESQSHCVYRLVIWYWAHQHSNANTWHRSWCSATAVLNKTVLCVWVCVCVCQKHTINGNWKPTE